MSPINTPNTTSFLNRLNTRFRESDTWSDFAEAVTNVINQRVTGPRTQLATLRDNRIYRRGDWIQTDDNRRAIVNHVQVGVGGAPTIVHCQIPGVVTPQQFAILTDLKEPAVVQAGCRFHGFTYFSDTLSDRDMARVHEWIEWYWPESGTPSLARFIGFVKNMTLNMDQLWSIEQHGSITAYNDAKAAIAEGRAPIARPVDDFYPTPESRQGGPAVWDNGSWFPTSHVQLRYDAIATARLGVTVDYADLFYLFYYLAPIHLVLERIVSEITSPPVKVFHRPVQATIALHQSALFNFEPSAVVRDISVSKVGYMGMHATGLLMLDSSFVQNQMVN